MQAQVTSQVLQFSCDYPGTIKKTLKVYGWIDDVIY